jgi:hypothetical protein
MSDPDANPVILCVICGKPVDLKTSKTDSNAEAVHEECYLAKQAAKKPPDIATHS